MQRLNIAMESDRLTVINVDVFYCLFIAYFCGEQTVINMGKANASDAWNSTV
jgi:hypothetical protein